MNRRFLDSLATTAVIAALWAVPTHTQGTQGGNGEGAMPTPRLADGHPDLSGLWGAVGGFGNAQTDASGNVSVILNARDGSPENFERDSGIRQRMDPNKPIYKPEFWDKVQDYDINGNRLDPAYSCFPEGVPRMGPPLKILATPKEIVFLYAGRNVYRVIPIDRPHDPINSLDQTWMGDPVGHWEGDTLVVDIMWVQRCQLARLARVFPQHRHAGDRTVDARREHDPVSGHGGGSDRTDEAMGDEPARAAAEHRSKCDDS